jgi:nucleoside-diphosphate-sugar epimerase
MITVNTTGSRTVLDAALVAGCDPVVYVSSMGVIFPPTGDVMSPEDPVAQSRSPYEESKAEAELYARGLQAGGHPVVMVYPGGVLGPKDLGVNGFELGIAASLKAPVDIRPPAGGLLVIDVRDLATALARIVRMGGARRYAAGGNLVTWDQLAADLQSAAGVRRPILDITEEDLAAMEGAATARFHLGLKPSDDGALQRDTGVTWRPCRQTLVDVLDWIRSRPG